jgi:hypothetical protein
VTVIAPPPVPAAMLAVAGLIEYVQAWPACVTAKPCPAMVAVPIRVLVAVFAVMLKLTDPGPVRPVPFWNVRNGLELVALQAQPACVVTATVPPFAPAPTLAVAGLIAYVHGTGAIGTVN